MPPKTDLPMVEKAKAALRHDPKRTAMMVGLAVIMLTLWGRMLMAGPAAATASFIRKSVSSITDPAPAASLTPVSSPVLDWLGKPKQPLDRNLFEIHLDYYARAGDRKVATTDSDPAITDEQTDQKRERQILLENLQLQASRLKLQTTMMGKPPKALINGDLVKEGDLIDGFIITRIDPRQVVIQQDGIVLQISMP